MNISVRSNLRTAEAARGGINPALQLAFRGGAVTGFFVVGFGLIGVALAYGVFQDFNALVGFAFGASLISVFARLGGGIYTKAADVGADLVGKLEAGIPEDDPRNPAVIADNVGDNVGDCAGMAADLFETYAVTAVATMLLGSLLYRPAATGPRLRLLPAHARRREHRRVDHRHVLRAHGARHLDHGRALPRPASCRRWSRSRDSCSSTILLNNGGYLADFDHPVFNLFWCAVIGIVITVLIVAITEFFTGAQFWPVRTIAKASQTGHATNIIAGLAIGMEGTAIPVLVIAIGILASASLGGLYGIGIAAMALLSMTGIIVAIDSYGPITDNAGGIAEMADLPEAVRKVTDPLDAVGNTTKAVTKGYAIGSAGLAALVLFASYTDILNNTLLTITCRGSRSTSRPRPSSPGCSSAASCRSSSARSPCSRSAAPPAVSSSRCGVSSARSPGIMEGTGKPEYGKCVALVTAAAQREMIFPACSRCSRRSSVGFILGAQALGAMLLGTIVVGRLRRHSR